MFYVYFDKDTKKILSISNEEDKSKSYVVKLKDDVIDFLKGSKNFVDYKFDKDFNFVNLTKKEIDINEYISKVEINSCSDICITHKNSWQFSLRENKDLNYSGNILFAVTQKNNPNILIRNFLVSAPSLNEEVEISFKYQAETDLDQISLWVFNSPYTCGIYND